MPLREPGASALVTGAVLAGHKYYVITIFRCSLYTQFFMTEKFRRFFSLPFRPMAS